MGDHDHAMEKTKNLALAIVAPGCSRRSKQMSLRVGLVNPPIFKPYGSGMVPLKTSRKCLSHQIVPESEACASVLKVCAARKRSKWGASVWGCWLHVSRSAVSEAPEHETGKPGRFTITLNPKPRGKSHSSCKTPPGYVTGRWRTYPQCLGHGGGPVGFIRAVVVQSPQMP